MKADTFTITKLFQGNDRYIIPLFQRPYVWRQETQWKPLWNDIRVKCDEIVDSQNNSETRAHFLGAVVISKLPVPFGQVPSWDVIDGQQRLTTLQLLLSAFRDYLKASDWTQYYDLLVRLTENSGLKKHENERFKVWPTMSDRAAFEKSVSAGSPVELNVPFPLVKQKYKKQYEPRPNIVEAYIYFYQTVNAFIETGDDDVESEFDVTDTNQQKVRIEALLAAITHHLEVVVIELGDKDDPQIIFESLNGRGEPLLAADLVRNFVFLKATRDNLDVERLYKDYWTTFDEGSGSTGFWRQDIRQGRLVRSRFDTFLFNYVTAQTGREFLLSHIFQEFQNWWNTETRNVMEELGRLQKYGVVFRSLIQPQDTSRLSLLAKRLQIMDTSTVYPLLLFMIMENASLVSPSELDKIFVCLESYLVRRMVCGLTSKKYNKTFLQILRDVRKIKPVTAVIFQEQLAKLDGDTARWPNDAEFREAWINNLIYTQLGSVRLSLLLESIESELRNNRQAELPLDTSLSIEHVMPQSITDNWPTPDAYKDSEDATGKYLGRRNEFIHKIGNLTLVTPSFNSSLGNKAFTEKRPKIAEQSTLLMNSYFQWDKLTTRFNGLEDWGEEQIRVRGADMFEVARKVWPHA